jgi:hypothetical protein
MRFRTISLVTLLLLCSCAIAEERQVVSPDGKIEVGFKLVEKRPFYNVRYNGKAVLADSALELEHRS